MGDQLNFRALLIQLQDGLSDRDRQRLHFLLGDLIPAQLRDDLTMGGTLNLLQNLLNRDKISEQDVTFLIKIFHKIHCHGIVQILKQHQESQQQHRTDVSESTGQSNTLIARLLDDTQEDRTATSNVYHVQHGVVYGGSGGGVVDDAKDYGFTYGDRCIAAEIHWSEGWLNSLRFIYNTSSKSDRTRPNNSRGEDGG